MTESIGVFGFRNPFRTGRNVQATNIKMPGCSLYATANQAITSGGTGEAIDFPFEYVDNGNIHEVTGTTSRITFYVPGIYLFNGRATWAASASGTYRELILRLNGNNDIELDDSFARTGAGGMSQHVAAVYRIVQGDYAELYASHDVGSDLNVLGAPNPRFSAFWLSA